MANTLAVAFGFVVIGLVLLSVLGAVKRREKFVFVVGLILLVAGPGLVGNFSLPATIGKAVSSVGFLVIVASTIPLLRQSPTTS